MSDQELQELLPSAAAAVARDDGQAEGYLALLGGYDERDQPQVDRSLQTFLERLTRSAWERGWTPGDVVQHARRRLETGTEPLLLAVIASEHRAYQEIDPRWLDQLTDFDIAPPYAELRLTAWAADQRLGRYLALHTALTVAGFLQSLPGLARLFPLPGAPVRARAATSAVPNDKMLARIRALLAKAEATDFPDEAEALSGKAQELMAKFSLDQALVDADPGLDLPDDSGARRIWVETPYVSAKAQLVGAVASANRCRTVSMEQLAVVTIVGAELDLQLTELLSTSLLVQANRAMLAAGKHIGRYGESRTRSFRQSFLMAYAQRIGERLQATAEATQAAVPAEDAGRLLPVLSRREEQVEKLFTKLFPDTVTRRTRITNGAGWEAGLTAADQAQLQARPAVRR
ncbi:DUF2786 domain-containing protein [Kribbella sp. CA-293567]|uniref:DUF2786 domain-containing protein n=1 Tax=Kribbella sp. CA-293567 TaxID=3002436 RepID=UPI0022DDC5A1|nr:DUF2786 domain-containing protein [Kribbella sp. CA-293567]WBQ04931.1 DUF2786 domain-containing protein [Kribbella sp. CA-293567]